MVQEGTIEKIPRNFIPADFSVTNWELLEPYFKDLLERKIDTPESLEKMVERYE